MRYLYVLLVLSIAAILWAVWAVSKHVRAHGVDEGRGSDAEDLVNSGEEAQLHPETLQPSDTNDVQSRDDGKNGSAQ